MRTFRPHFYADNSRSIAILHAESGAECFGVERHHPHAEKLLRHRWFDVHLRHHYRTVTATISFGAAAAGIDVVADEHTAYVAHSTPTNAVSVIDTATHPIIATVRVTEHGQLIAATPTSVDAYITVIRHRLGRFQHNHARRPANHHTHPTRQPGGVGPSSEAEPSETIRSVHADPCLATQETQVP